MSLRLNLPAVLVAVWRKHSVVSEWVCFVVDAPALHLTFPVGRPGVWYFLWHIWAGHPWGP